MNKHSIIISVLLALTGCAATGTSKTIPQDHARKDITVSSKYLSGEYECVSLLTSKGTIVLALNKAKAPASVSNFLAYTNASFYNGTIFHRVIDGFMIQGGGFDENLREKATGEPIVNEADNNLKNLRGTIAMARTAHPHSASSQFFINTVDNPYLDHTEKTPRGWGYAVFGEVILGMDVVDSIGQVQTGPKGIFSQDVPVEDILIKEAKAKSCNDI